ncbi:MAG: helix-turn-helix domain-containing protein [Bacilli bacterium]
MPYPSNSLFDKNNFNRGLSLSAYYKVTYNQFDMHLHHHPAMEIMYILYGKAQIEYTLDDVNYDSIVLNANQFVFIDSEIKHKLVVDTQKTSLLNCELLLSDKQNPFLKISDLFYKDEDFKTLINKNQRIFESLDNHFVLETIQTIHQYMRSTDKNDVSQSKMSTLLSTLLLCIASSYVEQSKSTKKSKINTAVNYIHNNYTNNIKIKQVADSCGISYNYLNTLFKQTFHMCVTDYINKYRIKQACERMIRTDMPLNLIISEVGFNNKMTFNRNFLKFMGTTPGQFRKNAKKSSYEINVANIIANID